MFWIQRPGNFGGIEECQCIEASERDRPALLASCNLRYGSFQICETDKLYLVRFYYLGIIQE